ncbi:hypothetical protein G647_02692 [Cladophialophora carrionii CBS 160.54]|uniref:Uncharacterized protein n=1 Tax=Cladophialophora carrionii CBS 160.54 TaxID=1279043 RepID=V9DGE4_9EURO|nr:uncharacterized protein G647_02692 [Cladophialophora carrionii CBS 160.54]ETI25915.1 hypothetical protein G647_02692 [Cladophialophora carrionii CBS 160.54]
MSPTVAPRSRLPPRPAERDVRRPAQVPPLSQGAPTRNIRPLIYAIGIAGIVGSGALIGAYLKTGQQQNAARKQAQRLTTGPQTHNNPQDAQIGAKISATAPGEQEYDQHLDILQTKRAQLIAQKVGLETKLRDFRLSQQRKADEERQMKEFGLKR